MANIKLVTDGAADIPYEIAYELGIEIVPLLIRIDEQNYRVGLDVGHDTIHEMLQNGHRHRIRTLSPPSTVFEQTYRRLAMEYDYIFSLQHSSRLSETYREAKQACARLPASLTRVEVIDSRSASMGMARW
ncbi:MAG: hypothetical protein HC893_10910 [Chloroflexaceae bacterium]|nr:hypothetical protein [Chloroflexaceae bacterium]